MVSATADCFACIWLLVSFFIMTVHRPFPKGLVFSAWMLRLNLKFTLKFSNSAVSQSTGWQTTPCCFWQLKWEYDDNFLNISSQVWNNFTAAILSWVQPVQFGFFFSTEQTIPQKLSSNLEWEWEWMREAFHISGCFPHKLGRKCSLYYVLLLLHTSLWTLQQMQQCGGIHLLRKW